MNPPGPAADAALGASVDTSVDISLDRFNDPIVRDLAWLLLSAPLLRAQSPIGKLAVPFESAEEEAATMAWLLALDRDPATLREHIGALRLTRLGRYAECLLAFFLRHGPALRLVAANVALRRAGRTLGECDFLVETARGNRLHWELAVKCYLHAGGERASLADYVGPSLQDRFDLKLAHLLDHQLPLSAREEFSSLGHVGPWEPQMFIKGWLFYRWCPLADAAVLPPVPGEVHASHAHGFWVTHSQWADYAADHHPNNSERWTVLPRLAWLAPRRYEQGADALMSADALAARLAELNANGPTMVAAFARAGSAQPWHESRRGFVVPDDWPEQAAAFAQAAYHQR